MGTFLSQSKIYILMAVVVYAVSFAYGRPEIKALPEYKALVSQPSAFKHAPKEKEIGGNTFVLNGVSTIVDTTLASAETARANVLSVSHSQSLQHVSKNTARNDFVSGRMSDINVNPERARGAVSDLAISGKEPGLDFNSNESGSNMRMANMHGGNEQFTGSSDADSGSDANDFSILIESIGSGNVEEDAMNDSFAQLSDFLSMRAAKEAESNGFRCPESLFRGGTDHQRLLLELNNCPVPDA